MRRKQKTNAKEKTQVAQDTSARVVKVELLSRKPVIFSYMKLPTQKNCETSI